MCKRSELGDLLAEFERFGNRLRLLYEYTGTENCDGRNSFFEKHIFVSRVTFEHSSCSFFHVIQVDRTLFLVWI